MGNVSFPGAGVGGGYAVTLKPRSLEQDAKRVDGALAKGFVEELSRNKAILDAGPDEAKAAQSAAVKAHTVIRQNGEIVAAVWRDGQTFATGAMAGKLNALDSQTAGMSEERRRDFLSQELARGLGGSVKVERYGESGAAPARGDTIAEYSAAALRARGGR